MSISKNSTYIFVSQSIIFAIGMASGIVITRTLGPKDRGIYFLVLTVNTLIVNVANIGIRFTNTYLLSKKKYSLNEVNSNSLLIAVLLGSLSIFVYFIFSGYINIKYLKDIDPKFTLLSISLIPFMLYSQYWRGIIAGINKFSLMSLMDIYSAMIGAIFSVIVVLTWHLKGLIWLWFITSIIMFFVQIYLLNRIESIKIVFSLKILKESILFGFVGHLGNMAYSIYSKFDVFIVNYFSGSTGVGYYSLASTAADKVVFVPGAITTAACPRLGESNEQDAKELASKLARNTLFPSVLTSVCIIIIAPFGIPLLYGKEFIPTIKPLLVLLVGMTFVPISAALSSYFTFYKGTPKVPTIISWVTLVINIPLCIILTAKYGFLGTSAGITVTHLVEFVIILFFFLKTSKAGIIDVLFIQNDDIRAYVELIKKYLKYIFKRNLV